MHALLFSRVQSALSTCGREPAAAINMKHKWSSSKWGRSLSHVLQGWWVAEWSQWLSSVSWVGHAVICLSHMHPDFEKKLLIQWHLNLNWELKICNPLPYHLAMAPNSTQNEKQYYSYSITNNIFFKILNHVILVLFKIIFYMWSLTQFPHCIAWGPTDCGALESRFACGWFWGNPYSHLGTCNSSIRHLVRLSNCGLNWAYRIFFGLIKRN